MSAPASPWTMDQVNQLSIAVSFATQAPAVFQLCLPEGTIVTGCKVLDSEHGPGILALLPGRMMVNHKPVAWALVELQEGGLVFLDGDGAPEEYRTLPLDDKLARYPRQTIIVVDERAPFVDGVGV